MADSTGGWTRSANSERLQRNTYRVAKRELTSLIQALADAGQSQLLSEDELSARLEVSRATVRSVLLSLQKDGVVQRVHGRGTYINKHALSVAANLSQDRPFSDLLSDMGYSVATRSDDIRVDHPESGVRELLDLDVDDRVCVIRRVFEASGKPAVFCIDTIPMSLLPRDVADEPNGKSSVFDFLSEIAERRVRYSVADVVPVVPDGEVADVLGISVGQPSLLLRHKHIDERDQPVASTLAYINDSLIRFSVIRTYTNS